MERLASGAASARRGNGRKHGGFTPRRPPFFAPGGGDRLFLSFPRGPWVPAKLGVFPPPRARRRVAGAKADEQALASNDPTPSRQIAARELLEEVQRRLSPEERQLVEMRNQSLEWTEIAEQLGGSAEALRKKLARALDRVSD